MVVVNEDPLDMKVVTMANGNVRYRRHNKERLKQILEMNEDLKALQLSQDHMEHRMLTLEEQLPVLGSAMESKLRGEFESRFAKIEAAVESLNENVSAINSQMNGQEKLHTSMLELLESVENIETKVDTTTPDLKREISKLEFNLAQITSTTSLLKEDQVGSKYTRNSFTIAVRYMYAQEVEKCTSQLELEIAKHLHDTSYKNFGR